MFVHLGDNPSPNLLSSARYARVTNPNARLLLITDYPNTWSDFPGEVIKAESSSKREIRHLTRNARYLNKIAGGYWVNTYERLFVLKQLKEILEHDSSVIHLESDVVIQSEQTLKKALANLDFSNFGVPRMSADLGIASILIAKNLKELLNGLEELSKLAKKFPEICTNDMKLLGLALNTGILTELPTWIPINITNKEIREYFLFDGAAIGQYLFGQDPIHNKGKRFSGFQNPSFPVLLSSMKWGVSNNEVFAEDQDSRYWFVNLHVHSKDEITPPMNNPEHWNQIIGEANGEKERKLTESIPEIIHSRGYSLSVRIEIFLREKIFSLKRHNK